MTPPQVTTILCTHGPDRELLAAALRSLAAQDHPAGRLEVVVVDNASDPEVPEELVQRHCPGARLCRAPVLGLNEARITGIEAAEGSLLVFVDDDNELPSDYVRKAVAIASDHPDLGAFGGAVEGVFDRPVARWKRPLLVHLAVRDHGERPLSSHRPEWGPWDPVGAGMVVRREVAREYVRWLRGHGESLGLGRRGSELTSGEDTLMARCANRLGLACGYRPELRLRHHIPGRRLEVAYLRRLMEGHGRSYVVLERFLGSSIRPVRGIRAVWFLGRRLLYRLLTQGPAGGVAWSYDWGFVRASVEEELHSTSDRS